MSSVTGGYILSAYLAVAPMQVYANPSEQAIKHLGKACYKQFEIDRYIKRLEKRYLNDTVRKYGGYIGIGARIVVERRVTYTWRF